MCVGEQFELKRKNWKVDRKSGHWAKDSRERRIAVGGRYIDDPEWSKLNETVKS